MPNTTNNNWPTPADTDLVKNGADAIRDLGNAIDTTLGVYSPVTPGLVKLSTVTFSAVASASLPAATFSATYTNYRIIVDLTAATADANIYMKMRVSSTDSSGAYYAGSPTFTVGSVNGSNSANNSSTGFYISEVDGATAGNHTSGANIDLMRPFLSVYTTCQYLGQGATSSGTIYAAYGAGLHAVSTSYDSVSVIASAGNISGIIRVYGYAE
jgi:hypothetical protein